MNTEKANCDICGNINEVKIATGYKNLKNKGKKYFTCVSCGAFQWVDEINEKTAIPPIEKVKEEENIEPNAIDIPSETLREPINQEPNNGNIWEAKDRTSMAQTAAKTAGDIVAALIQTGDIDTVKDPLAKWDEYMSKIYDRIEAYRKYNAPF